MASDFNDELDLLTVFKPVNEKVSEALSDSRLRIGALYSTLRNDPALSLLILRTANSRTEGLYNSVSSIKLALNILGKEKTVFLNNTIKKIAPEKLLETDIIDIQDFWRHSLTVALIAETIAKHIKRFSPINPDNLFCAALFHDLGIAALARQDSKSLEASVKSSIEKKLPFHKVEDGLDHAEAGAEILRKWGVPEKIYGPVWFHHNPSATEKYMLPAAVIHVADVTAQLIGMPLFEKETVPQVDPKALKLVGLSPERLNVIARDSMDIVVNLEKELKIN